jgi:hypothetical protein
MYRQASMEVKAALYDIANNLSSSNVSWQPTGARPAAMHLALYRILAVRSVFAGAASFWKSWLAAPGIDRSPLP